MRPLLPLVLAALALLAAAPAGAQDPAVEVALEADQVNQEHCASLYTVQVERAASATVAVADAWLRVDEIYAETGAVYLLYWRGALAQCLGREEAAVTDLTAFVESQSGSTMFASLVQNAKTRLRRLGGATSVGQGASASFLRLGSVLELELSWSAGSGFHSLACTDPHPVNEQTENAACLPGKYPSTHVEPAIVPASAQLAVDGFLSRGFGFGGRLLLDLAVPSGLPVDRAPGPTLQVQAGPQVRLLNSVASGGRAGWFRLEARFAASFTRMSPMAGAAKYAEDVMHGYLDAGSWALRHVGVAGRLEGAMEVGSGLVLLLEGRYAWFAPMPGSSSPRAVEGSPVELTDPDDSSVINTEEVQILPELISTSQMAAGGRVGLLLPTKSRSVAVGPFIGVDFLRATMTFPNDGDDCWRVDSTEECGTTNTLDGDSSFRKVYSTQRHDLYVTVGVDARFGVEGKGR